MTMDAPTAPSRGAGPGLAAIVRAVGSARIGPEALAAARRRPSPVPDGWPPIGPGLLKASDEQTVAAVAALLDAVAGLGAAPDAFSDWGIVVASRYVGRAQVATTFRRFDEEGAWGVSPHLIPHFALHAPAGTLSLALGSRGPNLGVGGGPGAALEGGLAALTWLSEGRLPGAWLVLTGHAPEFVPGPPGEPAAPTECRALALALGPVDDDPPGPRLRVAPGGGPDGPLDLVAAHTRLASALALGGPIYRPRLGLGPASCVLAADPASGLRLEWSDDAPEGDA